MWTQIILCALLLGCEGLTLFPGWEEDEAPLFERSVVNTVQQAVQLSLSESGSNFLSRHAEDLIGLFMEVGADGWVAMDLPNYDFGDQETGLGLRDLRLAFNTREIDLELQFVQEPMGIRVIARQLRLRVERGSVWIGLMGDVACLLKNDEETGLIVDADITTDILIDLDRDARLNVELELQPLLVHHIGFELEPDNEAPECLDSPEACERACSAGEGIGEVITELIEGLQERLNEMILPAVDEAFDEILGPFLEKPLNLIGHIHPRILSEYIATAADGHASTFLIAPSPNGFAVLGDQGEPGEGAALALDVGMEVQDHPCVPPISNPPLFTPGPPPDLRQLGVENNHLGAVLSEAMLNRLLWTLYRSGTLCLALDSNSLQELSGIGLSTDALALMLPGLRNLVQGSRPLLLTLDPQFQADDFPLLRFQSDPEAAERPGINVRLPRLGISVYALLEERWSRLFSAEVDARMGLSLQILNDEIQIAIAPPEVLELRLGYNELLDQAKLPELMELVLDLAAAALLKQDLGLQLPVSGWMADLNLPLDARLLSLRTEGAHKDYLSVWLQLTRNLGAPPASQPRLNRPLLEARLSRFSPVEGTLSLQLPKGRYQWRLNPGPWRPSQELKSASSLKIREPRLKLVGPHQLQLRRLGTEGIEELNFELEEAISEPPPGAPVGSQGCQQTLGLKDLGLLPALLLALLLFTPKRFLLLAFLFLLACSDKSEAPQTSCEESSDCPRGQVCLEGLCEASESCLTSLECCPGADCQGGVCVPLPSNCREEQDCPNSALSCQEGLCQRISCGGDEDCAEGDFCLAGFCHRSAPCGGQCEGACFPQLDSCRTLESCSQRCAEGEVLVVENALEFSNSSCDLSQAHCSCVASPPIEPADYGRYASMDLLGGEAVFAAYDADFGDLVFIEGVEAGAPHLSYLDGIPEGGVISHDPSGLRGGRTEPGPDRGRYARLKIDSSGQALIAYYDATAGDLRLLRGRPGAWAAPEIIDSAGDAGRYLRMALGSDGQIHLLYHAQEGGRAGLRYARGRESFEISEVSFRPSTDEPAPLGLTPKRHGLMPCLRLTPDGELLGAFYDGEEGWLYLLKGGATGFSLYPMEANFEDLGPRYEKLGEHDLGRFCDLELIPEGVAVTFRDETTHALLLYLGAVEGGGNLEQVDEGGRGIRRLVGADPVMAQQGDNLIIAYQDATENDLLLSVRNSAGLWAHLRPAASAGALGFYNSMILQGNTLLLGTLELRTTFSGHSQHRLWVFPLGIPQPF